MTDQVTPVPAPWEQTTDLLLRWTPSVQVSAHRYLAMHSICAAMAQWLNANERRSQIPDDAVVISTVTQDEPGSVAITAGMIREANR